MSEREWKVLDVIYSSEKSTPRNANENPLQHTMKYWRELIEKLQEQGLVTTDELDSLLVRLNRTGCYVTFAGSFTNYAGNMGKTTETYRKLRSMVQEKV